MAKQISYIDRVSGERCIEKVFGGKLLELLYGQGILTHALGKPLRYGVSRWPLFSKLIGTYYHLPCTRRAIQPFIETYDVDASEFAKEVHTFSSFADFFTRQLKPACRPIAEGSDIAVIPADGRYYFYENLQAMGSFAIKGQRLDLRALLQDNALAQKYERASVVLARLCPSDYHRFHFPIDCVPSQPRLINGYLYSVNPIAIKQNMRIFSENKRMITTLSSDVFGEVLYIEVGATSVGTIQHTYFPETYTRKGAEKGYFDFGGSALVLLFPEGSIRFDEELLAATRQQIEIRCLVGQSMASHSR